MPGKENIMKLHQHFKQLKSYKEKLHFYDVNFGCVKTEYPPFHPDLLLFFNQKDFDALCGLFEKERRKAIILEQRLAVGNETYLFNVTPSNSNTLVLNDYILYKFINEDCAFKNHIEELRSQQFHDRKELLVKWAKAKNRIE